MSKMRNRDAAMNRLTPVCAIAIKCITFRIPSETSKPANHIVPVVPMFAPSTHAIAAVEE